MEFDLKKLKTQYEHLAKKFDLPSFESMNERFEIEKLAEHETETLLREVRRVIMERASNYFKFIEMFINPSTASLFFLTAMKKMNGIDRKPLEELYIQLGKMEIESLALENEYSEKKEAEFINKMDKKWSDITKKFGELIERVRKSTEDEGKEKEKSYFG